MRVLDPEKYMKMQQKRQRRRTGKRVAVLVLAGGVITGLVWLATTNLPVMLRSDKGADKSANAAASTKVLKTFSGEEFKELYNSYHYANVSKEANQPDIMGNEAADERIRELAEKRGYQLRDNALMPLVNIDGQLLQAPAQKAWEELKAAAASDGLNLQIISGYRSVDEQRQIFLGALRGYGATVLSVATTESDEAVDAVLKSISVPGYSRHHTGYTIDLACDNGTLEEFEASPCFTWVSRNNYELAKRYGWIPSYPPGAGLQGPDPEPWEYVWVDPGVLYGPAVGG